MRVNDTALRELLYAAKSDLDPKWLPAYGRLGVSWAMTALHASMAIDNGAVFVVPKSLYLNLRRVMGRVPVDVKSEKLPYPEMFIVEVDDATGRPTAAATVFDDGRSRTEPSVYCASHDVVDSSTDPVNPRDGWIITPGEAGNNAYSTLLLTSLLAWLRADKDAIERVRPANPTGKYGKRKSRMYHGEYTMLRDSVHNTEGCTTSGTTNIQAHWVRGHFKRRKTGVYWWKPHIAGTGEVKHRDAYIVKE